MTRLKRGMYREALSGLFGLRGRQLRGHNNLIIAALWYNEAGEALGCGDLAIKDLERIKQELEVDELFIVLPSLVAEPTSLAKVIDWARYVIAQGQIFVMRDSNDGEPLTLQDSGQATAPATVMTRGHLRAKLSAAA